MVGGPDLGIKKVVVSGGGHCDSTGLQYAVCSGPKTPIQIIDGAQAESRITPKEAREAKAAYYALQGKEVVVVGSGNYLVVKPEDRAKTAQQLSSLKAALGETATVGGTSLASIELTSDTPDLLTAGNLPKTATLFPGTGEPKITVTYTDDTQREIPLTPGKTEEIYLGKEPSKAPGGVSLLQ
ncbi:MAG: hypothetical protein NT099_03420 [Candidatus Saganbacteria bacterium]|nr:hypothetical protein [Candidatus Saganbacteria bacterium]